MCACVCARARAYVSVNVCVFARFCVRSRVYLVDVDLSLRTTSSWAVK